MGKNFKKVIALTLSLLLITGCQSQTQTSSNSIYNEGTYTASATGYHGDVTVEVKVSSDKIEEVNVVEHSETEGVGTTAIEKLPDLIVEKQSLAIDVVSGATLTSNAILSAVEDALGQAGADIEALKVATESEAKEEVELSADVVVVGAGGAGLSAALSAAENDATVIVLEKAGTLGGTTITSGAFYSTGDPELAKRAEMNDTMRAQVEELVNLEPNCDSMAKWQETVKQQYADYVASGSTAMFDSEEYYMLCVYVDGGMVGDVDLIEWTCANADEGYYWLEDNGYVWSDRVVVGKNGDNAVIEPDIERCRRLVGDEEYGRPATQMIDVLEQRAIEVGPDTKIYTEVQATELISDNGKVVGVKAQGKDGTPYTIMANKGVVLATGGFASGVEVREKYNTIYPYLGEQVHSTNVVSDTGDGINMAEAVGAQLVDMEKIQVNKINHYDLGGTTMIAAAFSNILVNEDGVRFVNEYDTETEVAKAILSQPDHKGFLLADANNCNVTDGKTSGGEDVEQAIADGYIFRADTVEELAQQIGVDAQTLKNTIDTYNESVRTGVDEEFGRTTFTKQDLIVEAPFYATPVIPGVHHTMGGVKINENAEVLDTEGNPIEGLYAAGEVVGGLSGNNRMSGDAITANVVQGRVAGQQAANS